MSKASGEIDRLSKRLGIELDQELLTLALTHRSFAYESGGIPTNERLEFLGDSVLGIIITETLYTRFPDLPEGRLAKLRSAVVSMNALAKVARDIDLGSYVMIGKGEETTGGRDKNSILADTFEAVIGAIYIQHGMDATAGTLLNLMSPYIDRAEQLGAGLDWKTSLQELATSLGLGVPEYRSSESGPDHAKEFVAICSVAERELGKGEGRSKKQAEQRAAAAAYVFLEAEIAAKDG
ncbi:MAG TPA: ribonuclease III [Candidatus Nanopelagicaceae bacterium]|nr:ribonuclease III [Candidatus Nanopelagicaceae bacterium]